VPTRRSSDLNAPAGGNQRRGINGCECGNSMVPQPRAPSAFSGPSVSVRYRTVSTQRGIADAEPGNRVSNCAGSCAVLQQPVEETTLRPDRNVWSTLRWNSWPTRRWDSRPSGNSWSTLHWKVRQVGQTFLSVQPFFNRLLQQ